MGLRKRSRSRTFIPHTYSSYDAFCNNLALTLHNISRKVLVDSTHSNGLNLYTFYLLHLIKHSRPPIQNNFQPLFLALPYLRAHDLYDLISGINKTHDNGVSLHSTARAIKQATYISVCISIFVVCGFF